MNETLTAWEIFKVSLPAIGLFATAIWKLSSDISKLQQQQKNIQDQMISQKEFYQLLNKLDVRMSKIEGLLIEKGKNHVH